MHTVIIDAADAELHHEHGTLVVRGPDGLRQCVPLAQMDRIIVESEARISVVLVRHLAAAGIPLVVTRGHSRGAAALMSPAEGDARRRLRQALAWLDPATRSRYGRLVVAFRLARLQRQLLRWRQVYPAHRLLLTRTARRLRELRHRAREASTMASLRGLEGVGARLFFAALKRLLPAGLAFPGRRRRPPPDPVNAALSLGFALLHARALEVIHRAGLDASVGALHELSHGRPSLACDLVETERHVVEDEVLRLFRERTLKPTDFEPGEDGCRLGRSGRGAFFATMTPVLRRSGARMARRLAAVICSLPALPGDA